MRSAAARLRLPILVIVLLLGPFLQGSLAARSQVVVLLPGL